MAHQYDFGHNQILRAEFLNTLEDILSSYIDIFILTYSGNRVIAEGSVTDPIAVTIDGRMRQIPTTLEATVSGSAGTKDVFFVIRSGVISLEYTVSGGTPSGLNPGDRFRRVGDLVWTGATISSVSTTATMQNADYLAGRSSAQIPEPYAVAASLDNATLAPGWFPDVEAKEEPPGTVKRQWVPSSTYFSVPTGWAPLDGRTLTPAQHSFPGVGTIVLPDMRNKVPLGADLAKTRATVAVASNLAAAAPGLAGAGSASGVSGGMTAKTFSHNHAVTGHNHVTNNHAHTVPSHAHSVPNHNHTLPGFHEQDHRDDEPAVHDYRADGAVSNGTTTANDPTGSTSSNTGTDGSVTTSTTSADVLTTATLGPLDVRPAHVGLVFMLKVS